jgi:2-polyprenyl-3-methyl-5-hydroxy-6-metoxy-1,4-benzoquinol methylase
LNPIKAPDGTGAFNPPEMKDGGNGLNFAGGEARNPDAIDTTDGAGTTRMECPGCGETGVRTLFHGRDRLYRTTDKSFLLVECKSCRLIRLEPRPSEQESSKYYPPEYWFAPEQDTASKMEEAYRRFVLRDHVNFVMRAVENSGEPGLVVDVGCGGGLLLRMLRERGLPVLGLEKSHRAANAAWKRNHVAVVCGDLSEGPIERGTCAVVTMFHVLEHLHEPVSYLRSARDLLVPGGRLVIQVPNASSWQFLMFGEHWNGVDVPRHLVNYRQRDLEHLLGYCGFEVVRRKHFSLRDNPAGFASSIAPGLDPMARRVRKLRESPTMKLVKDMLYFGILMAALPFTLFEAACGAGSTIMVEARKKT